MDKVIAINDAPDPINGYYYSNKLGIYLDRAYKKGDIFDVLEWEAIDSRQYLVIYHDKLKHEMDVSAINFMRLEDYRELKINHILDDFKL